MLTPPPLPVTASEPSPDILSLRHRTRGVDSPTLAQRALMRFPCEVRHCPASRSLNAESARAPPRSPYQRRKSVLRRPQARDKPPTAGSAALAVAGCADYCVIQLTRDGSRRKNYLSLSFFRARSGL